MKLQVDELKKIAAEDPVLFIGVVDNVIAIIDLLLGIKDMPEVETKFKHSIELAKAEYLLDAELERKGALAERIVSLIFDIAKIGVAFK